jgi:hypothetical protein
VEIRVLGLAPLGYFEYNINNMGNFARRESGSREGRTRDSIKEKQKELRK